jgi:hypothetical protein
VPTNPPGILEKVTQRKVVRTLFDPDEEKHLKQIFDSVFRQRG